MFIVQKEKIANWTHWHVINDVTGEIVRTYEAYNYQKPATQAKEHAKELNNRLNK